MLVRRLTAGAVALLLSACAGPALEWDEPEREDPDPSGPRYLRIYKESHYRDLGSSFTSTLPLTELAARARDADVVFLGDHHDDPDLHARLLRVLHLLHGAGLRLRLGLECVGAEDQDVVDGYLAGHLTLDQLIDLVCARWPEAWFRREGLDGSFYRELLRLARRWGSGVFALEPIPRLALYERDQRMAQRIRRQAEAHPGELLVVIVGSAHLRGFGQLVQRVDLPSVTLAPRMSNTLREQIAQLHRRDRHELVSSDAGVLFFLPDSD